ncbi:hypothetical protein IWZ03DRAFT_360643 [Phyllosticta citriasiana]|uniref:Uncharacterized protein n=1 Tax=Phyllosticta citriasiana TaxID=595635 RepID=A0ABR1KK32_9PEZI
MADNKDTPPPPYSPQRPVRSVYGPLRLATSLQSNVNVSKPRSQRPFPKRRNGIARPLHGEVHSHTRNPIAPSPTRSSTPQPRDPEKQALAQALQLQQQPWAFDLEVYVAPRPSRIGDLTRFFMALLNTMLATVVLGLPRLQRGYPDLAPWVICLCFIVNIVTNRINEAMGPSKYEIFDILFKGTRDYVMLTLFIFFFGGIIIPMSVKVKILEKIGAVRPGLSQVPMEGGLIRVGNVSVRGGGA